MYRAGHSAGDAVAGRDCEEEGRDPEGVSGVVRELARGRPGGSGAGAAGKKVAAAVKFYLRAASRAVQEEAEQRGIWQTLLEAGAHPLPAGCGPCIGLGMGLLEPGEVGISATNRNFKGRMGSRDAQCYLAARGGGGVGGGGLHLRAGARRRQRRELDASSFEVELGRELRLRSRERSKILPGFPERVRGRLVFVPKDNLNTDGIYGKDYTYREDMTPEMMAGW